MEMYKIYVPTVINDKPVAPAHHKEWDKFVINLAGGLTIYKPVNGRWLHQDKTHSEKVIPVKIACTREQIEQIVDFTLKHYDQIAMLAYKISEEVIYRERK